MNALSAFLGFAAGWVSASSEKTQVVRLLDIALVGPVMMRGRAGEFLTFLGAATISYNLKNYLIEEGKIDA